MDSGDRFAPDALELFRRLAQAPESFGFFQVLRRIESTHRDQPRLGTTHRSAREPVRLAQEPSLVFAPSTLAALEAAVGSRPPRLVSRFLGLFGPNGPLPLHLTEYARDRLRNFHDPTLVRFLDLFHHRMLSLFYRAWAAPQPAVNYDRPESDRFAVYIGALFGVGMISLRRRDAMPDLAKLHFAGRLGCQTRHPEGLQALLSAFFMMSVKVEEFVGDWMQLPKESYSLLGSPETCGLGVSATIGARVWGCHQKFRVIAGPMSLADYRRLLPGGSSLRKLVAIVRNYVGDALSWDVNLVLKQDEVPQLLLGHQGQLGWTTWLGTRAGPTDADDLMLRPTAFAT
jgi:type VI secretion system protein ImpH